MMNFRASRFCVAVSNIPARFLFFSSFWALGFGGCTRAYLTFLAWHMAWHTAFHGSVLSFFWVSGYRVFRLFLCFPVFSRRQVVGGWLGMMACLAFSRFMSLLGEGELLSHGMALVDGYNWGMMSDIVQYNSKSGCECATIVY